MTYSPGSPGYPPAQPGPSYQGANPSFAQPEAGESKLPLYLTIAVVALGLAAYLASFGPMFTVGAELGGGASERVGDNGIAVALSVLAALLAALSLVPKAKSYLNVVAAIVVLGTLLVIAEVINTPNGVSIGWAMWFVLVCSVFQAVTAVAAVLLDAGVITARRPGPSTTPTAASTGNTANTASTAAASSRPVAATTRAHSSSSRPAPPVMGRSTAVTRRPAGPDPERDTDPVHRRISPPNTPRHPAGTSKDRPRHPLASPASARRRRSARERGRRAARRRSITPIPPGVNSPSAQDQQSSPSSGPAPV